MAAKVGKKAKQKKAAAPPKKKKGARKKKPKPVLVRFDPAEQAREKAALAQGPRWFPWACQGRIAARAGSLKETLAPPLELAWSFELRAAASGPPVAADDGVVYQGDREGRLRAFDLESGRLRFVIKTDPILQASPAWPLVAQRLVPGDRVPVSSAAAVHAWHLYFGDDEGTFYGVRRGEPEVLWRKAAPLSLAARQHAAYLAPLCAGELVVTADADGNLYAADGRSGRTAFALFLRGRPAAAPALAPWRDLVLATTRPLYPGESPRLHAVGLDGQRRWARDLPWSPGPGLAATQDLVLVGGEGGLAAFSAETGEPRWSALGAAVTGGLSLDAERVLAPRAGGLAAVRLAGGEVEWERPASGAFPAPLAGAAVLLAGEVAWMAYEGGMCALELASGKVLARVRLPGDPVGGPVAAGGLVLVATTSGALRAYRGSAGIRRGTDLPS